MPSSILRRSPRRDDDGRDTKVSEEQHPTSPAERPEDDRADDRAGDRPRHRDGSRAVPDAGDNRIRQERIGQHGADGHPRRVRACVSSISDASHSVAPAVEGDGEVVVEADRDGLDRGRRHRRRKREADEEDHGLSRQSPRDDTIRGETPPPRSRQPRTPAIRQRSCRGSRAIARRQPRVRRAWPGRRQSPEFPMRPRRCRAGAGSRAAASAPTADRRGCHARRRGSSPAR